eukprot:113582_1
MGSCTSTPETPKISREAYTTIDWTEKANIGFNLPTPPILNHQNEIIFLSTSDHQTKYSIYNLNTSQFTTQLKQIKCSNNTFDIKNAVYTYNPNNKKIYFIENNLDLLSLDMSNQSNIEIKNLNKSIRTTNNNYAQIYYNNNNVYVLGDESTSNPSNNEYIPIPYSSAKRKKRANQYIEIIKKTGMHSKVLNVCRDGIDSIYMLGGIKDFSKTPNGQPQLYPTNGIWTLDISNNTYKWNRNASRDNNNRQIIEYYTQHSQHSFGVINYKNKYIIIFGGEEHKFMSIRTVGYIWILCLGNKDKYGMKRDYWYELYYKLPLSGHYHAIYTDNNNEEMIHLFSYDGTYYTIEMNDILNGLKQRQYIELHTWMQAGKTVLPTKSKSIESIGPKQNSEVDDMLDGLGKTYEQYKNKLKDTFFTYDDILKDENKNKLEELIENMDHRTTIVQNAQQEKYK